jgi:alkyl hydroperoxide reductase 1
MDTNTSIRVGAFTPDCQARHLPPYIQNIKAFKQKGIDIVAVIASNDAWVMNAWGKVNGVKGDDLVSCRNFA